MFTVGSLFAGIGGFDLGLERVGFTTEWFVENDPYCQRVLAKNWPDVKCYGDIREVKNLPYVDVLCGGFPCQDISNAGHKKGIDGEKSSLWDSFARIIGEIRPRYVIVENVSSLRTRGLDRVLGDLCTLRYDAEWACIRASEVGALHKRDRFWLVAYPNGEASTGATSRARRRRSALPCTRWRRTIFGLRLWRQTPTSAAEVRNRSRTVGG